MSAFQEFTSGAGRGLQLLREAYVLLQRAKRNAHQAAAALQAATDGTGNHKVEKSIARLEQVATTLDQAAVHGVAGAEALKKYLTQIGADAALSAAPATATEGTPPVRRSLQGFRPGAINPAGVADIKNRVGYPRNAQGRISACGVLYDNTGTEISPEPYKPYRKGEQPRRSDLTEAFNDPEQTTTIWHSEADIAQAIRDGGLQDSTVYLNVPLCGKTVPGSPYPDPKGCYENYRHTIPEGTISHVVVVPEQGAPYRMKINGTGKGIDHG